MVRLKIFGAVMVTMATILFAFVGLYRLKLRLRIFQQLKEGMFFISSCINFAAMTIGEIFDKLANQAIPQAGEIYKYFLEGLESRRTGEDLWRESLECACDYLTSEDINIFLPLGNCLGCADKQLQLRIIEMIISNAEEYEKTLLKKLEKYRTVDLKVIVMGGIMAVILLI